MLAIPEVLKGVTHPLVSSAYLKKEYAGDHAEDVLIIKTNYEERGDEYESFDSYLMDLLGDLDDLRARAEQTVGHIDRIDIRA